MLSKALALACVLGALFATHLDACSLPEGHVWKTAKELTMEAPIVLKVLTAPFEDSDEDTGEVGIFLQEWNATFNVECIYKTPEDFDRSTIETGSNITVTGFGGSSLCLASPVPGRTYILYAQPGEDGVLQAYYGDVGAALGDTDVCTDDDGVFLGLSPEERRSIEGQCTDMLCTEDAMECWDGSFVVRDACCRFFPCPPTPCGDDICDDNEVCWGEECRPSCDGVSCRGNDICEFGRCVDACEAETLVVDCLPWYQCVPGRGCTPMCGIGVCDADEYCKDGRCRPDFCASMLCRGPTYCKNFNRFGRCMPDFCRWKQCPRGKECVNGNKRAFCVRSNPQRNSLAGLEDLSPEEMFPLDGAWLDEEDYADVLQADEEDDAAAVSPLALVAAGSVASLLFVLGVLGVVQARMSPRKSEMPAVHLPPLSADTVPAHQ